MWQVVASDLRDRTKLLRDGSVLFEAGPHPALKGDFAALCAALTP